MSAYDPPSETIGVFNSSLFTSTSENITQSYADTHYLKYPTSQSATETITSLVVNNDATINGLTVGRGAGSVATNTALGDNALSVSGGINNVAIGTDSVINGGTRSIGIGVEALYNGGGVDCVAVGYKALHEAPGANNTAVGNNALNANAGFGNNNTGIGTNAGNNNITGSNNTYVGYNALPDATNYSNSTALGSGAIITASNQVVLGTTSETVVIPRITRFLSPPIIFRTALGTQTIGSSSDTKIEYPTIQSSGTYTGITYSAGTFTNSNTYSIGVCVTGFVVFSANSSGVRAVFLENPSGGFRLGHSSVQAITVATEPTIGSASACFVMGAGDSFRMMGFQSSGSTLTIGTVGAGQKSSISIMVF